MSARYNNVVFAVSGTPGSGSITVGAAVSGEGRTPAAASVIDGVPVTLRIQDGSNYETSQWVPSSGATVFTRVSGGFDNSSTGSPLTLTSAAICAVVSDDNAYAGIGVFPVPGDSERRYGSHIQVGYDSSGQAGNNMLYMVPFFLSKRALFNRISVRTWTPADNPKLRLGVYASQQNGLPGLNVLDAGEVIGTTGFAGFAITINRPLPGGMYWLGAASSCTPGTSHWVSLSSSLIVMGTNSNFNGQAETRALKRAFAYGALPADETSASYFPATGNECPHIALGTPAT